MTNQDELRNRMAAIGQRYLARTTSEMEDLQRMIAALGDGDRAMLKEIEVLSHRIRGSGAVFGFNTLSDIAGVIEMLAVNSAATEFDAAQLSAQFAHHLAALAKEVEHAARNSAAVA